jgi:SAM-dependent methyltransferase
VAISYDDTRGGMARGRMVAAMLVELLPAAGPVLEVGVGTGVVSAGLAELGRVPVGVDLSMPMLAQARRRMPGRLAAGDALRLPVQTGAVASACAIHVLHLVGDIPAALAELARVLSPGGTLVATTFPGEVPEGDVHEEMDRIRAEMGADPQIADAPLVIRLAAEAGFGLVERRSLPGTEVTPRLAVDLMEARSMSWMWPVDEEVWARLSPPALATLRALPDQDRVRPGPGPAVMAFNRS